MIFKQTISQIFFVRPLKIDSEDLKINGFINAFVKDIDREINYEDVVLLLFKPKDFDIFKAFVDSEYERTPLLYKDYDIEGGYVVLVYLLSENWKDDWELIKEGKYSKTSEEFWNLFPKIVDKGKLKGELSLQWRIFTKEENLRKRWEEDMGVELKEDMEVWPTWNEDKETLNIKLIKSEI